MHRKLDSSKQCHYIPIRQEEGVNLNTKQTVKLNQELNNTTTIY